MKTSVLILGRVGFSFWLAAIAFVALGSLLAHPGPFVMMAFSIGGLPAWVVVHRHEYRLIAAVAIGLVVTAVPVLLLVDYGVEEGGVSLPTAVPLAIVLAAIASTLAWFGMVIGRLVWLPWK